MIRVDPAAEFVPVIISPVPGQVGVRIGSAQSVCDRFNGLAVQCVDLNGDLAGLIRLDHLSDKKVPDLCT